MSGTLYGSARAALTNKERHGKDFYKRIGSMGGKAETDKPKGFAAMPKELVSAAGKKGGSASKRGKAKPEEVKYIKTSLWNGIKERIKV